jgi:hypothetical protein
MRPTDLDRRRALRPHVQQPYFAEERTRQQVRHLALAPAALHVHAERADAQQVHRAGHVTLVHQVLLLDAHVALQREDDAPDGGLQKDACRCQRAVAGGGSLTGRLTRLWWRQCGDATGG